MRILRREFVASLAAMALPTTNQKVKFGVCAPVHQIGAAAALGFDYLEPAAADLAALSEAEFQAVKNEVLASPLRCEAVNSFIKRHDLMIVGPSVDLTKVQEYVEATLERCAQLGATVAVWGSAVSRNVPDGFSRDRAWGQIAEFLTMVAPIAARHNVAFCIEPLNKGESNILNTGHEALRMVNQVNRPEIGMIVDYYHFSLERESLDIFDLAAGKIKHLHFANPHGRPWPVRMSEDSGYGAFFAKLRAVNWRGGLSIEGHGNLHDNGAAALHFLREAVAA